MARIIAITLTTLFLLFSTTVHGARFSIGGTAGTMGAGGTASIGLAKRLNVRGEISSFWVNPSVDASDISYQVDLPRFGLFALDFYPAGGFHLSAGAFIGGNISLESQFASESVLVGDREYRGTEVGKMRAEVALGGVSPYVGLGFGNPVGKSFGLNFDIGVAVVGKPTVKFEASGPLGEDPAFQLELEKEQTQVGDDVQAFTMYPIISLSLTAGF